MSEILLRREDNPRIYNVVDKFSRKLGIKDIVVYEKIPNHFLINILD